VLRGSAQDAAVAAERVRAAFQEAGQVVAVQPLNATVSIGAAGGIAGADIMTLVAAADRALYKAKENGRNRVELADDLPASAGTSPKVAQPTTGQPVSAMAH
jgi:diguanylate cyclase (GGDEF)-like protein